MTEYFDNSYTSQNFQKGPGDNKKFRKTVTCGKEVIGFMGQRVSVMFVAPTS